jgi:hypothetical protein
MTNHTKAQLRKEYVEDGVFNLSLGNDTSYTDVANDVCDWWLDKIDQLLASKKAAIEAKRGMPTKFVPMVSGDYDRGYHHGKVAGLSTALDILGE